MLPQSGVSQQWSHRLDSFCWLWIRRPSWALRQNMDHTPAYKSVSAEKSIPERTGSRKIKLWCTLEDKIRRQITENPRSTENQNESCTSQLSPTCQIPCTSAKCAQIHLKGARCLASVEAKNWASYFQKVNRPSKPKLNNTNILNIQVGHTCRQDWWAGYSSLHCHSRLSVVIVGTATERMGTYGRYLATSFSDASSSQYNDQRGSHFVCCSDSMFTSTIPFVND